MKTNYIIITALITLTLTQASCEKVSLQGVLMAGTGVEDRVEMSYQFYVNNNNEYKLDYDLRIAEDGYSFLVGSDSHITTDMGRLEEMIHIGIDNNDLFYAHLGDLVDTKVDYYSDTQSTLRGLHHDYVYSNYDFNQDDGFFYRKGDEEYHPRTYDEIKLPFFPIVGNHDLTHNGWALWSNIFGSSFYDFEITVGYDADGKPVTDHFIFLDTASGTLGKRQIELIEQGVLDGTSRYRHTFIFSHTNIFLPSHLEFASTFPREEAYFLLRQFDEWNASIVFCGHVHKWDEQVFNGVYFLTLDSMSERNSPNPGDYLVRINVDKDGTIDVEKVRMNYVAKK